jgi:hypothetical protein
MARDPRTALRLNRQVNAARNLNSIRGLGRLDVAFLAAVGIFLLVAILGTGLTLTLNAKYGWLDDPILAPVPDKRRLTNLRDARNTANFIDGALDPKGRGFFLARWDGTLHRFDLDTELWSDHSMEGLAGIESRIQAISADCGAVPASPTCVPGLVWALSEEGGLAGWENRRGWRTVIGDTSWAGPDGEPVEHKDLTALTVSDNGRWILMAAGDRGMGLFDIQAGSWAGTPDLNIPPAPAVAAAASPEGSSDLDALARRDTVSGLGAVTHIVWAMGRFWIAGDGGLFAIDPSKTPDGSASPAGVSGHILDMERDENGALIVLSEARCRGDLSGEVAHDGDPSGFATVSIENGCLSLDRVTALDQVSSLLRETERDERLSQSGVRHVAIQNGQLVTVGDAGIHVYTPDHRNWETLVSGAVSAVAETFDGRSLYVAIPGRVVAVREARIATDWNLSSTPIDKILPTLSSGVLAVTHDQHTLRLIEGQAPLAIWNAPRSEADLRHVQAAAMLGSEALLKHRNGVVLHDITTRKYVDIPNADIPAALTAPQVNLYPAGSASLWAVQPNGRVDIIKRGSDDPGSRALQSFGLDARGTIRRFSPFGPDTFAGGSVKHGAFGILEGVGPVHYSAQNTTITPDTLIGRPAPAGVRQPAAVDVMPDGSVLVADERQFWSYNFSTRDWVGPHPLHLDGQKTVDLFFNGKGVTASGSGGRLVVGTDFKNQFETWMGHGPRLPFASSDLDDAIGDGAGRLILAGGKTIVAYDPSVRSIVQSWSLPGQGASKIRLAGTYRGEPVGLQGGRGFFGNAGLNLPGASVLEISMDGQSIVTVQERDGVRFLAIFNLRNEDINSDIRCYFSDPTPTNSNLRDVVRLTDDRAAVLNGSGVALYHSRERRWNATDWTGLRLAERLEVLGDHVVAYGPRAFAAAPLAGFQKALACGPGQPLRVGSQSWTGDSIAVDKPGGRAAFLGANGSFSIWENAKVMDVLAPVSQGPNPNRLRRVNEDGPDILFLEEAAAWLYRTSKRAWERISFLGVPDGTVQTLDARRLAPGSFALTLWMEDGTSLGGILDKDAGSVTLTPMRAPSLPPAEGDFSQLLDAAQIDGRWFFLFKNRLSVMREEGNAWIAQLNFDGSRSDRRLGRFGDDLVVLDGAEGATERLYYLMPDALTGEAGGALRGAMRDSAAVFDLTQVREYGSIGAGGPLRRIVLIDADGIARRCSIVPGPAELIGCERLNHAPVRIEAPALTHAYEISGELIVWYDGVASLLNREARNLAALSEPAQSIEPTNALVYKINSALLFLTDDGRAFRIDGSGGVTEIDRDIARLFSVAGSKGLILSAGRDGRNRLFTETGAPVEFSELVGAEGIGDFSAMSRSATGLSALRNDGVVVHTRGDEVSTDTVLTALNAPRLREPLSVMAGRVRIDGTARDGVWLQDGAQLTFSYARECPDPKFWNGPDDGLGAPMVEPKPGEGTVCAVTPIRIALSEVFLRAPIQSILASRELAHLELRSATEIFDWDGTALRARGTAPPNHMNIVQSRRSRLVQALSDLADGTSVLDMPTLEYSVSDPSSHLQLTPRSSVRFEAFLGDADRPDPLSGSWLRWRPTERMFELGSQDGFEVLPPGQIVADGEFLPALPGRFYRMSQSDVVGLTRHGLWRYRKGRPVPEFEAMDLSSLSGLAHGRALLGQLSIPLDGGVIGPDDGQTRVVRDDLMITEEWRSQDVAAVFQKGLVTRDVFASSGFVFDQREAAGWIDRNAFVLTPIGAVSTSKFALLAPRPPTDGQVGSAIRFHTISTGNYSQIDGATWYRLEPVGHWVSTKDPYDGKTRWSVPGRIWVSNAGRIDVRQDVNKSPLDLAARLPNGAFSSDVLIGAVADPNGFVMTTRAGTFSSVLASAHSLNSGGFAYSPLPPDPVSLSLYRDGSDTVILVGNGENVRRWDMGAGAWAEIGTRDPRQERVLAEVGRIRVSWRSGWETKVCIDVPGGDVCGDQLADASLYRSFSWDKDDYFPFDEAGDIQGLANGDIAVGTSMGLRILGRSSDRLIAMMGSGALESVDRIEVPYNERERDRVVALSATGCLMLRSGRDWEVCPERISLNHVYRGQNDYWRWGWRDGVAEMTYRHPDGSEFASRHRGMPTQHFPHDSVSDLIACGEYALSIRSDGFAERFSGVLAHPTQTLGVVATPDDDGLLFCLGRAQSLGQGVAAAGAYFVSGTAVYRLNGLSWSAQGSDVSRYIRRASHGFVQPQFGRFRLARKKRGGFGLELLRQGGQWSPLDWAENGRLEIDVHLGSVAEAHGSLWYRTAAGWLRFRATGSLEVDPVNVLLIEDGPLKNCEIDRIETMNGVTRGAPATAGEETRLRCGDGRVYQAVLDGATETGVFQPLEEDPFAARPVSLSVSGGASLDWTLAHPAGGDIEANVRLNGEATTLNAGRFAFDDLRTLRVFEPGLVEVLSRDGWYRTNETFSIGHMARWDGGEIDGARAIALTTDRVTGSGEILLCIALDGGGTVSLSPDGQSQKDVSCRQHLGEDGLWSYRSGRDGMQITAQAENGPIVERRLEEGRFSDLHVTGLPVPGWVPNSHVVPTREGVSTFATATSMPSGLYAVEQADGVVVPTLDGSVVYLSRTGVTSLTAHSATPEVGSAISTEICSAVRNLYTNLPPRFTVLEGVQSSPEIWDFRILLDGAVIQRRAFCSVDPPEFYSWALDQNVASRPRMIQNIAEWGGNGSRLLYQWVDGAIQVRDSAGRIMRLETEGRAESGALPVRLILEGDRLFFVTGREVYAGDVDAVLVELNAQTAALPRIPSLEDQSGIGQSDQSPADGATASKDTRQNSTMTKNTGAAAYDGTPVEVSRAQLGLIQKFLQAKGLYAGPIDGLMGPLTRMSIQIYEGRKNLPKTGQVTRWLMGHTLSGGVDGDWRGDGN